jgi:hypothetical protein
MLKRLRKHLPNRHAVLGNRWLRPFHNWLHHPNLWHLNRRSVAGGVAIGLFAGLIPGPLQMLGGTLLAITFRVNLPVAVFTTFYTNPFTILPLYLLAYEYGALLTGTHNGGLSHLNQPELSWDNWLTPLLVWFDTLGRPFFIGLPMLGVTLALVGYVAVRLLWKWRVIREWQKRAARRR